MSPGCYSFLPLGHLTVCAPPAPWLMMGPVTTAEWLTGKLSTSLETEKLVRQTGEREKGGIRKESIWSSWYRRVGYGDETLCFWNWRQSSPSWCSLEQSPV